MLDDAFIRVLALDDVQIARAARSLNRVLAAVVAEFGSAVTDVPACRALAGQSAQRHVESHVRAFGALHGVRLTQHLVDFGHALTSRRLLAAALAARGALETSAAIVHFDERVVKLLADHAYDALLTEVHRSYAGGRYDWFSDDTTGASLALYAAGEEPPIPDDRKATNILTSIAKLDRRVHAILPDQEVKGGAVRAVYAMLSDMCHPATGTGILFTEPGEEPGWVRIRPTADDRSLRWFFWNVGLFVAPIADLAHGALRSVSEACRNLNDALVGDPQS